MASERALRDVAPQLARPVVLGCGLARREQAYVRDGLRRWGGGAGTALFVDTLEALESLLATLTHCDALVLAPRDATRRDATATVERVAARWPGTPMVVFFPAIRDETPSVRALALAGAHQFVFEGVHDTAAAVMEAVRNAQRECAADHVFREMQPLIPTPLHPIVATALGRPDAATSVEAVAAAMGIHRKTLVNWCARSRFLQPGELIVWCRLAMAAHLLERTGATVESIGITLGFPSHTSLRNLVKRYTAHRATDIRTGEGLRVVIRALETRLTHSVSRPRRALPIR